MSTFLICTKTTTNKMTQSSSNSSFEYRSIGSLFDVKATIQGDKITFEKASLFNLEALPFLGRSGLNNGVVDYVKADLSKINPGKVITVALDGSTGATFYQHHPFCSGQNIWILIPKTDIISVFDQYVAIYLVASIRKAVASYSYNLSLTKTRLLKVDILVPVINEIEVDVQAMRDCVTSLRNAELIDHIPEDRLVD
jgi:hypothetical protein